MKANAIEIVTGQLIEMIENGVCPWSKPWQGAGGGLPLSGSTGKPYNGINLFVLAATAMVKGYESRHWLTFKQAKEIGGKVRKGEKSTAVIFWKLLEREKDGEIKKIPFARYYRVFNADQVEGLPEKFAPEPDEFQPLDFEPEAAAELLVASYSNSPEVRHEGAQAYYDPAADRVTMPAKERFKGVAEYYSTLFHELAHSTGHKSRLDRLEPASFGSHAYGLEELVAEMSSAILCAEAGLSVPVIENQAAYLASWLKTIKEEPGILVSAASKASKAVALMTAGLEVAKDVATAEPERAEAPAGQLCQAELFAA